MAFWRMAGRWGRGSPVQTYSKRTTPPKVGLRFRVEVVKDNVAPPLRQAEFDIMHVEGVSQAPLLVDIVAESGVIEKSGVWYG